MAMKIPCIVYSNDPETVWKLFAIPICTQHFHCLKKVKFAWPDLVHMELARNPTYYVVDFNLLKVESCRVRK